MEPKQFPETDLLRKYLDGTITEQESVELFAFLKENPIADNEAFDTLLQSVYQQSFTEKPALTGEISQRILDRLLASVQTSTENNEVAGTVAAPVHRVHFLRRSWFRYAAAAVLIVTAGTAVLLMRNSRKVIPTVADVTISGDIPAGSNRAVLKLANGQKIPLDSAAGSIIHKVGFNVINDSGKLNYQGKTDIAEYHTLSTPRGGQYKLQLPDGTQVWLNAASSITYPTAFTNRERKVEITGEAYFEVTKNPNKPFIVALPSTGGTGGGFVEVLGTHFNINAYEDEQNIQTTLLEGRIRLVHQRQTVVLKPGQQAAITSVTMQLIDNPDLEMVMAWKNGSFSFKQAHLNVVLRQLSRWYDVDIAYEKNVPDILFSGEIKRDLTLSQALTILDKMGVHCSIQGKKLIVKP